MNWSVAGRPWPPYSLGQPMPSQPSLPMRAHHLAPQLAALADLADPGPHLVGEQLGVVGAQLAAAGPAARGSPPGTWSPSVSGPGRVTRSRPRYETRSSFLDATSRASSAPSPEPGRWPGGPPRPIITGTRSENAGRMGRTGSGVRRCGWARPGTAARAHSRRQGHGAQRHRPHRLDELRLRRPPRVVRLPAPATPRCTGTRRPTGPGFWAVTKYDDCVAVNRDYEHFSSAKQGHLMWDMPDEQLEQQR